MQADLGECQSFVVVVVRVSDHEINMAEGISKMLEKSPKMSTRDAMIALAGSAPMHGELPRWLGRVSRLAGISVRTARSLWNDEIRDPEHRAVRAVQRQAQIEEARRDAKVVADFFNSHAQALANIDPDFHRDQIDAFVEAARIVSGRDRT